MGKTLSPQIYSPYCKIEEEVVVLEVVSGIPVTLTRGGFLHSGMDAIPDDSLDNLIQLHEETKQRIFQFVHIRGYWCEYEVNGCHYTQLPTPFLISDVCSPNGTHLISWDGVERWASYLRLPTLPVAYRHSYEDDPDFTKLAQKHRSETVFGGPKIALWIRPTAAHDLLQNDTVLLSGLYTISNVKNGLENALFLPGPIKQTNTEA